MVRRRACTLLALSLALLAVGKARAQSSPHLHRLPSVHTLTAEGIEDGFFDGCEYLAVEDVVGLAVERNPTVAAMTSAWRAAAQRYPQVVSLDDPMFMAMAAPASFHSSDVEAAYVLQGSQKFPAHGKRAARGRAASAETRAALSEVQDARLVVVEMAQSAYFEYYLAHRQTELTKQNTRALREFRDAARTKYENNVVTEQDVLQAEIQLAEVERRSIELVRDTTIAKARINTLLLRFPDAPLPPPRRRLNNPTELVPVELIREMAIAQRPDLAGIAARLRAEQANVTLALKQYHPDADIFGRYDSFWQPVQTQSDLRGQVGVTVNVPIYHRRLNAAVREAQLRVAQRKAEYEQKIADIHFEVQSAYARVEENRKSVALYSTKFLPNSDRNANVARNNYDVGTLSFLDLIRAQQQAIELNEKAEEALVEYHRSIAELERAAGGPLPNLFEPAEEVPKPNRPSESHN